MDPARHPYWTIESSKKNGAFLFQYKPELPFLRIEGIELKIKDAWVEFPQADCSS
jgi:hypothetical protein